MYGVDQFQRHADRRSVPLIIDGTDNFPTRYLVNDVCVIQGKPNCYGSIFRFEGQASVFGLSRRPLLSLSLSATARPGRRAKLRRRWRVGRVARDHRHDSSDRGDQNHPRQGETLSGRLLLFDASICGFAK